MPEPVGKQHRKRPENEMENGRKTRWKKAGKHSWNRLKNSAGTTWKTRSETVAKEGVPPPRDAVGEARKNDPERGSRPWSEVVRGRWSRNLPARRGATARLGLFFGAWLGVMPLGRGRGVF